MHATLSTDCTPYYPYLPYTANDKDLDRNIGKVERAGCAAFKIDTAFSEEGLLGIPEKRMTGAIGIPRHAKRD